MIEKIICSTTIFGKFDHTSFIISTHINYGRLLEYLITSNI